MLNEWTLQRLNMRLKEALSPAEHDLILAVLELASQSHQPDNLEGYTWQELELRDNPGSPVGQPSAATSEGLSRWMSNGSGVSTTKARIGG